MKKAMIFGVGALAGTIAAPFILDALNIPTAPGVGLDDVVTAAVIVAAIFAADRLF